MTRYVAFLRAINVGARTVKMDRLRALFESLGFRDVETFIASGNVIFTAAERDTRALEERIEQSLAAALGFPVTTFVRQASALPAIAACKPIARELDDGAADGCAVWVGLLKEAPGAAATKRLAALCSDLDELRVGGAEAYWLSRTKRMSDSNVSGALVEKTLGVPATFRNVTTVRKLAAKYAAKG